MPLTATTDPGHHQFVTDNVYFYMNNGDRQVRCGITRSALEVLAPELPHTKQGRVQAFTQRRARIEHSASVKFDRGAVEPDGRTVLIRVFDLI
jgi:hypothetical protein